MEPSSYPILQQIFRRYWDTSLEEFSSLLFSKQTTHSLEPALLSSFEKEWEERGEDKERIQKSLQQLKENPILQTSHHVAPTNGPTFLALDLISLAGLPPNDLYLVGANSSVPFSNAAWSGALCFNKTLPKELFREGTTSLRQAQKSARERREHEKESGKKEEESRISLIPSRKRDDLLYRNRIIPYQLEKEKDLTENCRELLHPFQLDSPYSTWATKTCEKIQKKVLGCSRVFYFDVNRVINRYLLRALDEESTHPINLLFFSPEIRESIVKTFENPAFFFSSSQGKKSDKVLPIYWEQIASLNQEELREKLEKEELCPGLFVTFLVLRFLNGIRCLGSFLQIEYIEDYRKKWAQLSLDWNLSLESDYFYSLTTGRLLIDEQPLYPLDLAMQKQTLLPQDFHHQPMRFFWQRIAERLKHP